MKNLLKSIPALLLVLALLLTACTPFDEHPTTPHNITQDTTPENQAASTPGIDSDWGSMGLTSGGVPIANPGQLPIVQNRGDITIEIMVTGHPAIINWDTNAMSKWMEEQTNIVVNWRIIPLEGRLDTLSMELTSANYPDAFMSVGMNQDLVNRFGVGEGRLLPITGLIPVHAPNLMGILDLYPGYQGIMTMLDNEIYMMPSINQCYHCTMYYKMWINQDFLNQVGMAVPTTTEELVTVLKAFRDQIPNSIPFAGTFLAGWAAPWTII